jgi:hypothetical protein
MAKPLGMHDFGGKPLKKDSRALISRRRRAPESLLTQTAVFLAYSSWEVLASKRSAKDPFEEPLGFGRLGGSTAVVGHLRTTGLLRFKETEFRIGFPRYRISNLCIGNIRKAQHCT